MKAIELIGLTKVYKKQAAIDQVNLSVENGEIYGFIGPNGAGKSTTIKAMLNFIYPDQGTATLLGLDSIKDAKEIRKRTGYVSSDVRFYPHMTTGEILQYVADFHQIKNSKQQIDYFIELFDIDRQKKMSELSLGNKKKVAITAGILPNPELLILDEPTNGLDPLMQHRLFEELEKYNQKGMTIFLSSHDLNEVQQHAHRAAFIRQGKIITVQDITKEKSLGKVITLIGDHIPLSLFEKMGAAILKHQGNETRLFYEGDLHKVLPLLGDESIEDFTVTNPELEDQFMALYEGGAAK
ncbi:ABC transporter ATP-binding protein [Enterococcus ureilyticus]|uniref:ABC transporter ATP-binding protein n=1 Tax=Enterococcus ureilyticus TaxID=1131292 RepID=A0A1E5HB72_9ENTE|nr:ABC transporter ATP-binding protein [Enterococcus ureilyticus]MBM7690120.1 ABC-2 type transport system ATP-binding protein [Enterococcus ureilyticus]OEG22188.1 ABC transporter ATP-binding protein [Enterococcus ureilyticus]